MTRPSRLAARPRNVLAAAVLVAAAVLAVGAAGCGSSSSSGDARSSAPVDPNAAEVNPAGDIPDDQAFVAFTPPGARYSVKVPEGWAQTSSGRAVTFTDKLNAIRMEAVPAAVAPTVAAAKRTEVPRLRRTVKGFRPGNVSTVQRTAGQALRITYLAAAEPDPVTGKSRTNAVERYVFPHGGQDLVLTLSGPKGADNVDPWKIVTDSVRWSR
jgi:hypothetical protein